tara:strand:- start:3474 stop:4952 length:1479 start_codon:yes stop_codon:yes gene_type:complete
MHLKVKDMDIATGGPLVALLNYKDAIKLDLHHGDRVLIKKGKKQTVAIIDIAESKKALPPGQVGLFEEVLDHLKAKKNDKVNLDIAMKPESVAYIKKKLEGKKLTKQEIHAIVKDIVSHNLTDIEICYFIAASFTQGLSMKETVYLTKAIVNNGDQLKLKHKLVADKHCSGGVPGNRTTMIVIPICVAAGIIFPKTSSRSITSPAGTADAMEVLCNVVVPVKKMKQIVNKVGGCIVWGGGVNLATADDHMIKIRHPVSLDPEGMLLASIMAKKHAVNANHVLIDIPIGPNTKFKSKKTGNKLKRKFIKLGKQLGIHVKVMLSDGTQPIGNGIGPALEARDVLYVLQNHEKAPQDLKEKSLSMAVKIMKMSKIKNPHKKAKEILESGKAYEIMKKIIKAQGGNPDIKPERIPLGRFTYHVKAASSGKIHHINNHTISKIARIAGAPLDKGAGIYLYRHVGNYVIKGDKIFTIYAQSEKKLKYAIDILKRFGWD